MALSSEALSRVKFTDNFQDMVSMPFYGSVNAICWKRGLNGDFSEIIKNVILKENIEVIEREVLLEMQLSAAGNLAREIILNDINLLEAHGADPVLNVISYYERDNSFPFFPTDVYSYHVDRSPITTDTILCTYFGASSDILANEDAVQKILIPEIRGELKKLHEGSEEDFELFLSEYFFDLHYQAKPGAEPLSLGIGNMWRLAVDCPESPVLPCIHRAPKEHEGEPRLLLIC